MPSNSRGSNDQLWYPFAGIPSFLRSKVVSDLASLDADIAIVGVPTDEGSPFLPGSRFAPRAIREHSLRFASGSNALYDLRREKRLLERELILDRIADVGDVNVWPTDVVGTFARVTERTAQILAARALPVILGGDHSISYPVVRAFEGPLHVVHFDAHVDYAPFVHGLEYTNAHAFRHIARLPQVRSLTQVGIRSLRTAERTYRDSIGDGNRVLTIDHIRAGGTEELLRGIPKEAPCYVSIDIDVLDMALVPGCVSAEPDGLSYAELRALLVALAEHVRIVGLDLVEVNPTMDVGSGVTSYLATHLLIEFLGSICAQPYWLVAHRD